jgi:hypothetical protein
MDRRRPRATTSRRRRAPSPRAGTSSAAERELLALARELSAMPGEASVADALRRLAAAYAPDAALPRAAAEAWLHGRGDKTGALALAWAREQVRLALEERLARAGARGAIAADPATRAWLLLAAAESIAHEPPAAVADRLRTLLELSGQPSA